MSETPQEPTPQEPTPQEPTPQEQPYGGMPTYGSAPGPGTPPQQWSGAMTPNDENTWSALAHFGGIILGLVAPLIVLLVKGNDSPRVRAQAVEALNFQISMMIYAVASVVLILVVIGIFTLIAVCIAVLVLSILAGVKALNGEDYRYPLTIRLVS